MKKKIPSELDKIVDKVLSYRPKPKKETVKKPKPKPKGNQ
jgi:hypothetical protein